MESFRSEQLELCSTLVQSTARGFLARKRYSQIHARIVALQALSRGFVARRQWQKQQSSTIAIQCMYRNKAARFELAARREAHIRQVEEQMRKAEIAAEQEASRAAERNAALERQKGENATIEAQEAERNSLGVAELKSELEKVTAQRDAAIARAAESKSRIVKLEAENKNLKQQIKLKVMEVEYSGRPPSHYAEYSDLRGISEGIGSLTQQSKKGKKDLDSLVKALEILK